jgi:5-methylcytosine-specific restriction protein A
MARKRFTDKDRARIFAANNGCCHLCGFKIDGVREAWEVEHVIAWELTRDDSTKTHTQDRPAINEAKRREAKHFGVKRPKASIPSRPKEHRPARDRLPMPGRAQDIFGKPISKEAQTP